MYREIIRQDPQRSSAYHNLGIVLISEKKYPEALVILHQALKINPRSPGTHALLGMAYYELYDSQRAISAFQTALDQNPMDANALLYLAKSQMQARDYQHAAETFGKLGRFKRDDPDVLYGISVAHLKLMMEAVDRLHEVAPNSYRFWLLQAQVAEAWGDDVAALHNYQEALRANPETVGAHYGLGGVYVRLGKYDEAAHEYREGLKLNPNDSLGLWKLGVLILRTDSQEARGYLERAVALNPNLPQAVLAYGRVLLMAGETEKAIPQFQRVVELAPEEDSVHYLLATAYRKLGREKEASEEIARFEDLAKKKSDRRWQMARETIERGRKLQEQPPDIEPGFSSARTVEHPQ